MPRGHKITTMQKLLILSVYVSVVKEAKSSLFPDKALRSAVKSTAEQVGLHYETVRKIISKTSRRETLWNLENPSIADARNSSKPLS